MTPKRFLAIGATVLLVVYAGCWAIGYLPWWMVLVYSQVVTVAWAETGD